jgi:mRNA interferase RelE/StbE
LKVRFKASFATDLRALKDRPILDRIKATIATVESAESLLELSNLKKLRGGGAYYRVRVGDYRVGIAFEEDTVVFVRVLHRREVYRYFP